MSWGKDPDQGQGWKSIEERKFFEESCLNFSVNKKFDNVGSGLARVGYDFTAQFFYFFTRPEPRSSRNPAALGPMRGPFRFGARLGAPGVVYCGQRRLLPQQWFTVHLLWFSWIIQLNLSLNLQSNSGLLRPIGQLTLNSAALRDEVRRRYWSTQHLWRMTNIIGKLENSTFRLILTILVQMQIF